MPAGPHHPRRWRPGHSHGWSHDKRHQEIQSAEVDSWPEDSRNKLIIQDLTLPADKSSRLVKIVSINLIIESTHFLQQSSDLVFIRPYPGMQLRDIDAMAHLV